MGLRCKTLIICVDALAVQNTTDSRGCLNVEEILFQTFSFCWSSSFAVFQCHVVCANALTHLYRCHELIVADRRHYIANQQTWSAHHSTFQSQSNQHLVDHEIAAPMWIQCVQTHLHQWFIPARSHHSMYVLLQITNLYVWVYEICESNPCGKVPGFRNICNSKERWIDRVKMICD